MDCEKVLFSGHAVRRMFERAIGRSEVMEVVRRGTIVAEYMDDEPFPSYLISGTIRNRHLHVVVALEAESETCYIVTAYNPDPRLWEEDFKTRRPK